MRYILTTIFSLILGLVIGACNNEERLEPATQNSYIKIIQGRGSDAPFSVQEMNGDLLIVSNSAIRNGAATANKIRVLRTDLNGEVINGMDKYYPNNLDQNWTVTDVIVIDDQRIVLGGTVGSEDSLFFLELNQQLDSVNAQYYSSDMENYQLTGFSYKENSSKILFGGWESQNNGNENTLFGELNESDFTIDRDNIVTTSKAKAVPATTIIEDASGGLIWAYNDIQNSVIVRSPNRNMNQIDDIDDLSFDGGDDIVSKKLIENEDGQIVLFGEFDDPQDQRMLFFYEVYSGIEPVPFGGNGQNQLNGAKQIEGGYLVAGLTEVSEEGSGDHDDFYLSRRGPNGTHIFSESFGSDADEALHDAVMVNDNIYSIGSTNIGIETTLLLIKTNKFGKLVN